MIQYFYKYVCHRWSISKKSSKNRKITPTPLPTGSRRRAAIEGISCMEWFWPRRWGWEPSQILFQWTKKIRNFPNFGFRKWRRFNQGSRTVHELLVESKWSTRSWLDMFYHHVFPCAKKKTNYGSELFLSVYAIFPSALQWWGVPSNTWYGSVWSWGNTHYPAWWTNSLLLKMASRNSGFSHENSMVIFFPLLCKRSPEGNQLIMG